MDEGRIRGVEGAWLLVQLQRSAAWLPSSICAPGEPGGVWNASVFAVASAIDERAPYCSIALDDLGVFWLTELIGRIDTRAFSGSFTLDSIVPARDRVGEASNRKVCRSAGSFLGRGGGRGPALSFQVFCMYAFCVWNRSATSAGTTPFGREGEAILACDCWFAECTE